jgi:hypothetical protein
VQSTISTSLAAQLSPASSYFPPHSFKQFTNKIKRTVTVQKQKGGGAKAHHRQAQLQPAAKGASSGTDRGATHDNRQRPQTDSHCQSWVPSPTHKQGYHSEQECKEQIKLRECLLRYTILGKKHGHAKTIGFSSHKQVLNETRYRHSLQNSLGCIKSITTFVFYHECHKITF